MKLFNKLFNKYPNLNAQLQTIKTKTISFCKVYTPILIYIIIILLALLLQSNITVPTSTHSKTIDTTYVQKVANIDTVSQDSIDSIGMIKTQLHNEVFEYIEQISVKTTHQDKQHIASSIIKHAIEHDVDICFMLAQAANETHIGSFGVGKSKKSMFGVIGRSYSTYDECVSDYVRVLNKYYKTKGRTESDLMQRYVTSSGSRYASNPQYEVELRKRYNEIRKTTNIHQLQNSL